MKVVQKNKNGVFHGVLIIKIADKDITVARPLCNADLENPNRVHGDLQIVPNSSGYAGRYRYRVFEKDVTDGEITCKNCLRKFAERESSKLYVVRHKQSKLFVKNLCRELTPHITEAIQYRSPDNASKNFTNDRMMYNSQTEQYMKPEDFRKLFWKDAFHFKEVFVPNFDYEVVEIELRVKESNCY